MKKLFLYCLIFATSINLFSAQTGAQQQAARAITPQNRAYTPAPGPLQMGDVNNQQGFIMYELMNNPTNTPKIGQAYQAIQNFTQQRQVTDSYQIIMTNLQTVPVSQAEKDLAIAAISAIETTIMHLYDQRAYMLGSYQPGQSIVFTGLRKNLFNSEINKQLDQLIQELYNLADVASLHSTVMGKRIWATAHAYRHWRRNIALGLFAYFCLDTNIQGLNNSTAYKLYQGGLSNSPRVLYNAGSNLIESSKALTSYSWNYAIKPSIQAIFLGAKGFSTTKPEKTKAGTIKSVIQKTDVTIPHDQKPIHALAYLTDAWISFVRLFNTPISTQLPNKPQQTSWAIPTISQNIQELRSAIKKDQHPWISSKAFQG